MGWADSSVVAGLAAVKTRLGFLWALGRHMAPSQTNEATTLFSELLLSCPSQLVGDALVVEVSPLAEDT